MGPLPWLLCTKHRNPAGWGHRAETRTQRTCSGEEAPRDGGQRRPPRKSPAPHGSSRVQAGARDPCGGQRRRLARAFGGVGVTGLGVEKRTQGAVQEQKCSGKGGSVRSERARSLKILERQGLERRKDSRPIQGAEEGWGAGGGLQSDKD